MRGPERSNSRPATGAASPAASAVPAEVFGDRQQENGKALDKTAAEHGECETESEHIQRGPNRRAGFGGCLRGGGILIHTDHGAPFRGKEQWFWTNTPMQ